MSNIDPFLRPDISPEEYPEVVSNTDNGISLIPETPTEAEIIQLPRLDTHADSTPRLRRFIREIGRLVHNDPWRNRPDEEQHFT